MKITFLFWWKVILSLNSIAEKNTRKYEYIDIAGMCRCRKFAFWVLLPGSSHYGCTFNNWESKQRKEKIQKTGNSTQVKFGEDSQDVCESRTRDLFVESEVGKIKKTPGKMSGDG